MCPKIKHLTVFCCVFAMPFLMAGCEQKIMLFNGQNLDGWKPVLSNPDTNPADVWSFRDGVLRCEGKPNGYIRTEKDYSNYTLHLEWRWTDSPTNSGVLLHIAEPDKIWPVCIEAQLMHQNAGDFYAIGGTGFEELKDGNHLAKQHETNEKEPGQWNTYDIICLDRTITLYVNSLLQNKATKTTVNSGKIGLQSEGSPIEFRNIILTPIRK
ncbi:MAG: DUF1080 domain-containing protein [Phycisphaerae bacterium]|nr:DUF1080 domain-containing protein [Phycisphaerae bacterium]